MTDIFQDSFEHAPIGICHTAGDGTFLRVNRRFADMLGYTAEDLYRRRLPEITRPEDVEADAVSHAFPADRKGEVTIRMRMSDGAAATLTVGDNGAEIPESMDWRQAPGLGLRLVQAVAEIQFNGAVNLERGNGNHFSLVFELPETSAALHPQNN